MQIDIYIHIYIYIYIYILQANKNIMISIALNEKLAKIADSAYFEYNMWSDIKEVLYNLNINFINLDYNCLKIFCNR